MNGKFKTVSKPKECRRQEHHRESIERSALAFPAGNQAMLSMLGMENTSSYEDTQQEQGVNRSSSGGTPLEKAMRERYEQRFGLSLQDVRVHRNSEEPNRFSAIACTYGSDIFLKPQKDSSLDHEITHVAQQKMGLVRPTDSVDNIPVNTSKELEHGADMRRIPQAGTVGQQTAAPVVQCEGGFEDSGGFKAWRGNLQAAIKELNDCREIYRAAEKDWENAGANYHTAWKKREIALQQYCDKMKYWSDMLHVSVDKLTHMQNLQPIAYGKPCAYVSAKDSKVGSAYFNGPDRAGAEHANSLNKVIARDFKKNDWTKEFRYKEQFPSGGRLRLLHDEGPVVEFNRHVLRGMGEKGMLETLVGEAEHRSRGTPEELMSVMQKNPGETESEELIEKDWENLFDAVAYADMLSNRVDKDDDGNDVKTGNVNHGNDFLYEYMRHDEHLKRIPLNRSHVNEASEEEASEDKDSWEKKLWDKYKPGSKEVIEQAENDKQKKVQGEYNRDKVQSMCCRI